MNPAARIWHFIGDEDSIWSWVVNVLLAFVIIKFLLYPGIGWALGTSVPIVAVVSGSMEHNGNLESYWNNPICCDSFCARQSIPKEYYEKTSITLTDFKEFDFANGFNKGDIMILKGPEQAEVGDVIVYLANRPDPIIHRVIEKNNFFKTKGDNNCESGEFEQQIPMEKVLGKAVWRVPLLGWVKIFAVELLNLLR